MEDNLIIKLITPVYFIATKLEAYKGRGNDASMVSRDIEDILTVVGGLPELVREIKSASIEFQRYIKKELSALLEHSAFDYAVQSTAHG